MRIGIVKLSSLGDVVHALPLATALRRGFPEAWVAWVAEEREAALLDGHPDLDAVARVDTRRWRRLARRPAGLLAAGREIAAARRRLRALDLDVAIDAQGLLKSGAIAAATGARVRIGFGAGHCRERASAAFTHRHVNPPAAARHVVDQYLALLGPLGLGPAAPEFRVPTWPEANQKMRRWLAGRGLEPGDRVVLLNPGAGRPDKRWPAAAFRAVASGLVAHPGATAVVVWGPGEREQADAIAAGLGPAVAVAPPTDLHELAALLRRATLVVAGDTGPLHLAAAVGTACLGLFGPTAARRNGPYGARHRALESPDRTMRGIDPVAVLCAAREMLDAA
jgi:lipopolysaccharide heptosyltransferase I